MNLPHRRRRLRLRSALRSKNPGMRATLPPATLASMPSKGWNRGDRMARPRVVIVGAGFGGSQPRTRWPAPRRRHGHRPAQLSSVPAAALPGGDRRPVAGRDRLADPRHPAPAANVRSAGQGHGDRPASAHIIARDRDAFPTTIWSLATGARHAYFGHDDWEGFAPGLKKIDDATDIRRRILLAFEQAESEPRSGRARGAC